MFNANDIHVHATIMFIYVHDDVPAAGISANMGAKNTDTKNSSPHTTVLSPVLAPALIPAADSGLINMGGPLR